MASNFTRSIGGFTTTDLHVRVVAHDDTGITWRVEGWFGQGSRIGFAVEAEGSTLDEAMHGAIGRLLERLAEKAEALERAVRCDAAADAVAVLASRQRRRVAEPEDRATAAYWLRQAGCFADAESLSTADLKALADRLRKSADAAELHAWGDES